MDKNSQPIRRHYKPRLSPYERPPNAAPRVEADEPAHDALPVPMVRVADLMRAWVLCVLLPLVVPCQASLAQRK